MQSPEQVNRQGILVTGFLGFEGFEVNPSALLAQSSGRDFELIEVSYRAVDEFLQSLDANRFTHLLMLGVAGKSSRMRFEHRARNVIGQRNDVRGEGTGGMIDPAGPAEIPATLWSSPRFREENHRHKPSDDAGDYLCNYIFYRASQRFGASQKKIGFLHVPPQSRMPLHEQQIELAKILGEIT